MRVMRVTAGHFLPNVEICQRQKYMYEQDKPRHHLHHPQCAGPSCTSRIRVMRTSIGA